MNKREKTLAIVLGSVLVGGVLFKLVYPNVIEPMFDYGSTLDAAQKELADLEDEFEELEGKLKERYHDYVLRTGSTETAVVSDEILQRINTELSDANMEKGSTVTPRTPSEDKRTKVATLRVSVSAPGKFADCIQFVRGVYRMPYIVRFNSIKLTPIGKPQRKMDDWVKLDAEIEATILPQEKLLGAPPDDKPQPLYWDERLASTNTRTLEQWKPFIPYSKPAPPKPPPVEVVDEGDKTPPTPPPPPPGAPTDPDAGSIFVRGRITYGVDEVLLYNQLNEEMSYVAVGEELDAGELVLAHTYGAVAHKVTDEKDFGYYVYPLGESLAGRIKLEDASQWPEIQVAMEQYFELQRDTRFPDGAPGEEGAEEEATEGTEVDPSALLSELDAAVALDLAFESAFVGPPYVFDPETPVNGRDRKGSESEDIGSNSLPVEVEPAGGGVTDGSAQDAPQPTPAPAVQGDDGDGAESPAATAGENRVKRSPATTKPRSRNSSRARTPSRRRNPVGRK